MSFRKFGTSDEQKVELDEGDKQGLSKSAVKRITALQQDERWTTEDAVELQRENKA
jgi:hypothetical protein